MKTFAHMRVWYALVSVLLWMSIYLTGFATVNWLIYVPAAGFVLATILGFCPSQVLIAKFFRKKQTSSLS